MKNKKYNYIFKRIKFVIKNFPTKKTSCHNEFSGKFYLNFMDK